MQSLTVAALLTDAAGMILLVRRKRSALWRLPGGEISYEASVPGMMLSLCRRQIGVAPDFVAPPFSFTFAGRQVIVGPEVIEHDQARASGWIEAMQWYRHEAMPFALDPVSAIAISLGESQRTRSRLETRREMVQAPQGT